MNKKIIIIFFLILGIIQAFGQRTNKTRIGVIDDTYEVNALGAYNHIIPIHVAPGVNGMEPKLAIVYDSRSGLSELGYGWAISGLSKISRGGNNLAQHGKVDGINFNSGDAILLDGQLLTCVSGQNANVGSKYKTENESNAMIIASDEQVSQGSKSPNSFVVKQPNGLTYYYGSTNNSKVVLSIYGKQEVLEWNVSKIEDTYGNSMSFVYEVKNNISRILTITYTSNQTAGILPKGKVIFRYFEDNEFKRQSNISYFNGNLFQNLNLLKSIDIESDGKIFKSYNLEFNETQDKLISLKECTSSLGEECLPKTIFKYDTPEKLIFSKKESIIFPESEFNIGSYYYGTGPIYTAQLVLTPKNVRNVYQDFNNDGNNDLLVLTAYRTSEKEFEIKASFYISEKHALRFEYNTTIAAGKGIKEYKDIDLNKVLINDFNGDGLLDIVTQTQLLLNFSNYAKLNFKVLDSHFEEITQSSSNNISLRTADLNGDLKSEIIVFDYNKKEQCDLKIFTLNSKNHFEKIYNKTFKEIISTVNTPDDINDIDANGLPNILLKKKNQLNSISVDSNYVVSDSKQYHFASGFLNEDKFLDMNLDGYPDIVRIKEGENPIVWLFDGVSISTPITLPEKFKLKNSREYQFGNFSRQDAVQVLTANKNQAPILYDVIFSNSECLMPKAKIQIDFKEQFKLFEFLEKSGTPVKLKDAGGIGDELVTYQSNDFVSGYDHDLDGGIELVISNPGRGLKPTSNTVIYKHQYFAAQRLIEVKDGFGNVVEVEYSGLKDKSTYVNTLKSLRPNYEYYNGSYPIVKTIKYSNGVNKDSLNINKYLYEDLIIEKYGRGLSGFKNISKNEVSIGNTESTEYLYEFPLSGKILFQKKSTNENQVSFFEQANIWEFDLLDGISSEKILSNKIHENVLSFSLKNQTYRPLLKETEVTKRELNGEEISKSKIEYLYNKYGFINISHTTLSDGTTIINEKQYKNIDYTGEGSNQILGLVTNDKTYLLGTNNDTSEVRTIDYSYNEITGSLTLQVRQQNDDALKQSVEFEYDNTGNLIKKSTYKNPLNKIEEISVFENNRRFIKSTKNPMGHLTEFKFDSRYGNIIEEVSHNNLTTKYLFDDFGKLNKVDYPDNTFISYEFDYLNGIEDSFYKDESKALYKLTTSKSGSKDFIQYYDMLGREVSSSYSLIDNKLYPEQDILSGSSAYNKQVERLVFTHLKYDNKGNVLKSFNPSYIQRIYDGITSKKYPCIQFEDSIHYASAYEYDNFNRITAVKLPDGNIAKSTYGSNVKTNFDFKGVPRIFSYNSKSELTEVTDANNETIRYQYDLWGNLIEIKNPNGQSIITSFDALGRKTKLTDPSIGTIEYKYDEFDRLIGEVTNGKKEINLYYDKLGRIIKKKLPEGEIIWKYDQQYKGMVDSIIDYHGNLKTYKYSNIGQIVSETQCIDNRCHTLSYSYDSLSRLSEKIYPSGYIVRVEYVNNIPVKLFEKTKAGKLKELFRISDLNALGQITNKVFGNGIRTKSTFNQANNTLLRLESFKDPSYKFTPELKTCPVDIGPDDLFIREFERPTFPIQQDWRNYDNEIINQNTLFSENNLLKRGKTISSTTTPKTSSSQIQDLSYNYDQNYNISRINDLVKNDAHIYIYDDLNRLVKYDEYPINGLSSTSIIYNNFGNITYKSDTGDYVYDTQAKQRVIKITGKENHDFLYDVFGNLTEDKSEGLILEYTSFNKPNRLFSPKAGTKFIKYGVENEEIKSELHRKAGLLNTTQIVSESIKPFSDYEIVYNRETKITDTLHYITFGGDLILIHSKQSNKKSSNQFVHKDQLGSIHLLTDDNGIIIAEFRYDPFGLRNQTKRVLAQKGFTGHEHLDNFGLINMGGRYYYPSIGRFVSADPFVQSPTNLQSLNRYSYVLNNPVNLSDPSGFWSIRKPFDFSKEKKAVSRAINNIGRELGKAGQGYIDIYANTYNEGDRFVNKYGKQIVIVAAAAAITYFSGGSMAGFGLALLKGAAVGAGMSAGMTAYHGGNFQDVLNASYSGAINGAASGALFNGVGDAFANENVSSFLGNSKYLAKVGAHGAAGGITSEAGGGTFKDGFLSASISQALTPANEKLFGTVADNPDNKFARIAFSGSVGSLAAHVSGGNVFLGTTTAIYGRWFNDEGNHKMAASEFVKPSAIGKMATMISMAEHLDKGNYFRAFGAFLQLKSPVIGIVNPPLGTAVGVVGFYIENGDISSLPASDDGRHPGPKY